MIAYSDALQHLLDAAKPLPATVSSPYITLSKPADEPAADTKSKKK